jgi:hypothetical protein
MKWTVGIGKHVRRVATVIYHKSNANAFGAGVAGAVQTAGTFHAARAAAATAAAGKHRVAAATDASVDRGHT